MQLGRGETIADTARVLSRYVDAIMIRILDHEALAELAAARDRAGDQRPDPALASLPGHGRRADLRGASRPDRGPHGRLDRRRQQRAGLLDARRGSASTSACDVATPPELAPHDASCATGSKQTGADDRASRTDPEEAVAGADCVVTDTWVSMGDEDGERRHNLLKPYQVNARLMAKAKPDAIFMHCLPAHRGEEVTAEVIDGPQSVVFDEAENRLHAQKGILAWCLDASA